MRPRDSRPAEETTCKRVTWQTDVKPPEYENVYLRQSKSSHSKKSKLSKLLSKMKFSLGFRACNANKENIYYKNDYDHEEKESNIYTNAQLGLLNVGISNFSSLEYSPSDESFINELRDRSQSEDDNSEYARQIQATKWTFSTDAHHYYCKDLAIDRNEKVMMEYNVFDGGKSESNMDSNTDDANEQNLAIHKVGVVALNVSTLTSSIELASSLSADNCLKVVFVAAASLMTDLGEELYDIDAEVNLIDDDNNDIDVYELARFLKGCDNLFFGVHVWNIFVSAEEEHYAIIVLRAAYLCKVDSIVLTTYEDSNSNIKENDDNDIIAAERPSTAYVVQTCVANNSPPSFEGMKRAIDYADSVGIEIKHTATLVSSKTGKCICVTYIASKPLQTSVGVLPGFELLDEAYSNSTISTRDVTQYSYAVFREIIQD